MPGAKNWATDVPISEPQPLAAGKRAHGNLGAGWTFTTEGMRPDLTEDVAEYLFTPTFAPTGYTRERG